MKEKIVFFDIDGTLLDEKKNLPDSTVQALRALHQQKDTYIAIATGRAPFMFMPLLEKLGIRSYISFNGSFVVYEENVLYKNPLSTENLKKLEAVALTNGHPMVFLDHEEGRSNTDNHPHIKESIGTLKLPYPPVDATYYHNKEIYQALLFCTAEEEHRYELHQADFDFVRWHEVSTDVLPLGGSKAKGIEEFLKHTHIKRENTYAFGDGLNDVEMLQFAGTGVAMGNGVEEAKKAADYVTEHVGNDGLSLGLKKLGLI